MMLRAILVILTRSGIIKKRISIVWYGQMR